MMLSVARKRARPNDWTEVFNKLHSLDHLWKIACDYRADHKGPGDANKHTLKTPAQARDRGPRPEVSKRVEDAMTKDLQQKKITYDASRDTVRKARNKSPAGVCQQFKFRQIATIHLRRGFCSLHSRMTVQCSRQRPRHA